MFAKGIVPAQEKRTRRITRIRAIRQSPNAAYEERWGT